MYINSDSGVIYPEPEQKLNELHGSGSLDSAGMLYGNTNIASSQPDKSFSGTVFDTSNVLDKSDQDTLIDRTDVTLSQEDVSHKLENYRNQLKNWKTEEKEAEILNSFGLDMNSGGEINELNSNRTNNNSDLTGERNDNSKDRISKDDEFDQVSFEPVGYQRQTKRTISKDRKSNMDRSSRSADEERKTKNRRFNFKRNTDSKSLDRKPENKQRIKKKNSGKAGKVVKKATKASLITSSNFTAKGLLAAWGLGSALVKQDIFFRIILGLCVGTAFVTLVLVGS